MPIRVRQVSSDPAISEFSAALDQALRAYGIDELDSRQRARLQGHYAMLRKWNQRTNLTRIIEPEGAARLHYADSLFGGRFIGEAQTILDIGSGAGFPAIPLAILRPDVRITALEANQKKSLFLSEAQFELGLSNFNIATARVESFDLSAYDLLTSRALDRADEILPGVIERLQERQRFLLYCAPELLGKLIDGFAPAFTIETHAIPQTVERLVVAFSRA
jgi:16S rRNA (guanine527-N7)-methyltransferase